MEKADPVIGAELMVTAEFPDEVRVSDCVVAVFTVASPKLRLLALTVNLAPLLRLDRDATWAWVWVGLSVAGKPAPVMEPIITTLRQAAKTAWGKVRLRRPFVLGTDWSGEETTL
jgi:hypothetical protein